MPDIIIDAADGGNFSTYIATPNTDLAPSIVVIQEIFGVNQVMRNLCNSFAAAGYIAACPDLFWRIEPGVQLTDQSQEEWDRAFELMNAFLPDFEKGVSDIQATIDYLRVSKGANGKVGAVGYCLGGSLAYAAGCFTDADVSVGYYPVQIEESLELASNISHPLMLHIAEADGFCPPEAQARINEELGSHDKITLHTYPGVDHAFARIGGGNYNAEAATLADQRSQEFLSTALG